MVVDGNDGGRYGGKGVDRREGRSGRETEKPEEVMKGERQGGRDREGQEEAGRLMQAALE